MHLMFRFGEGHGGKQTYTDLYITSSYFVVYKIGQGADSSFDEYVTCDPKNIHPDGCPKIPTHSVLDRMRSTLHVLGKSGYLYTHICVYIYIYIRYIRTYMRMLRMYMYVVFLVWEWTMKFFASPWSLYCEIADLYLFLPSQPFSVQAMMARHGYPLKGPASRC